MVAKVLLRSLLGPVVLALKLLNLFLAFVMAVSSTVLGIVSALFGLLAVLACFALSWQNGLGLLVVAWLVSPLGIPLVAVSVLDGLEKLEGWLVERIYH